MVGPPTCHVCLVPVRAAYPQTPYAQALKRPRLNSRVALALLALAGLLALAVAARLLVGGTDQWDVLWPLRAQRVAGGIIAGSALAVAGVLLQGLLRNPLASPDLLGMASGAGLGVMTAVLIASRAGTGLGAAGLGIAATGTAALVGALAALALVYLLAQRKGLINPVSLVLIGVVVGVVCGAGMSVVQYLIPPGVKELASRWSAGAIRDDLTWAQLLIAGAIVAAVSVASFFSARTLDAASLPDDEAASVGVVISRLRLFLFLSSGILAATSVVIAGPIGFVGLICPHVVRLAAGPAHRTLVVGAALAGAALVVWADVAVRLLDVQQGRLPLSVFTAIVGGPVLVLLLRRWARDQGTL